MLDHLDDIASDMSVFHQVRNIKVMPARSFWRLAFRLPAYQGVMAVRVAKMQEDEPAPRPARHSSPRGPSGQPALDATTDVLRSHPAFSQMQGEQPVVSFVKGGDGGGGR